MTELQGVIEQAWDERDSIGPQTKGEVRQAVDLRLPHWTPARRASPSRSRASGS